MGSKVVRSEGLG